MTEREKLNKRHSEIISKAIHNNEEVEDLYDVDKKLLSYALDYIPIKVLKKIFARYK
jgi:hypothetical protein